MSEKTITDEEVRQEHLREVNPNAHWAYVFGVLLVSAFLMILLIALMAGAGT